VKCKHPTVWLNTDLDSYLREQDGSGAKKYVSSGNISSAQNISNDGRGERRKAARRLLSGFGVVHTVDPDGRKGRYRLAQLRDISTTGIGLRLNAAEPDSFGEGREFEILFQFLDHAKPLHMACTACRNTLDEAGVVIGALFKNPLRSLVDIGC